MAGQPDLGELQRLVHEWLVRHYPRWRSAYLRADVGEREPLKLPIPLRVPGPAGAPPDGQPLANVDSPQSLLTLALGVLFSPMEREALLAIGDGALLQKEIRSRLDIDSETKLRIVLANLVDRGVLVKVTGGYKVADARLLELLRAGAQGR